MAAHQLHADGFDAELWDVDGDLWCVHRPRTLSVAAMALWFTLAGFAALGAIGCGLAIALAGEGGGFWFWTLTCTPLAGWSVVRGRRALAADRAIRTAPIGELPRVIIERGSAQLRDGKGATVPLAEVLLAQAEVEVGDATRHELTLTWKDRHIVVFHAARAEGLAPAIAALRRAGVASGPTITSGR